MTTATAQLPGPAWATTYTRLALAELPHYLADATPAQVDEAIRTIELDQARQGEQIRRAILRLHEGVGHDRRRIGRDDYRWFDADGNEMDDQDAVTAALNGAGPDYGATARAEGMAQRDAARRALAEMRDMLAALHGEYDRRGGWTRYYRVNNSNGHVHTDTACRTTYVRTQWQWPTQLSGATHAEVVEAAGELTCLVCFPDVREDIIAKRPIDAARFETREQTADREAREAEATAKRNAKIAKGITADGSPLVVQEPGFRDGTTWNVEIKTARAGELRYVEFEAKARLRRTNAAEREVYRTSAETILAALAAKRDTDVETLRASFAVKVDRKVTAEDW